MASEVVSARLYDAGGKEKGVVPLSEKYFGGVIREELIHGAVRWQRAKARAGTHSVLTRSEMKGGGKKPFKQKGTGRARAGSILSPIWVGGAVVHGPTPRSYEFRMSKKMRAGALVSTLTLKTQNGAFAVIESMESASGKTRDAAKFLEAIGAKEEKVLIVVPNEDTASRQKFAQGFRNLPKVKVLTTSGVNVYDLMNARKILCVREALSELEARLGQAVE